MGEGVGVQRIERDIDTPNTECEQIVGEFYEAGSVCRERDAFQESWQRFSGVVFGEEVAELAKQLKQIFTNEGFAAGDANCFDTVGDEEAGEAIEFFEGKDIAFRQEVGALWHAVATAQIAAIGDGQAEVVDRSAAAVDEGGAGDGGNEDGLGRSWRFGEHGEVLGSYLRLCSVPFLAQFGKGVGG